MPSIVFVAELPASSERVFAVLADFRNDPAWRANVVEMIPSGSVDDALGGIWSRQTEVRQVPGRQVRTDAVITAFSAPRIIAFQRASGAVRPRGKYTLTPIGPQRTSLEFRLDVELDGAQKLLAPVVALLLNLVIKPTLPADFARLAGLVAAA